MKSIVKICTVMLLMCSLIYSMQNNFQRQQEQQRITLTNSVYAHMLSGQQVPPQLIAAVAQVDAGAGIRASQHNQQLLEKQREKR